MTFRDKEQLKILEDRLKEAGVEYVFWNTVACSYYYEFHLPKDDKQYIAYKIVSDWCVEQMDKVAVCPLPIPFDFHIPFSIGYTLKECLNGPENLAP